MKTIVRGMFAGLAVAAFSVTGAQAQLTSVDPACVASILDPAYSFCSGAWSGNVANQLDDIYDQIDVDLAANGLGDLGGLASYEGTTDAGMTGGPFSQVDGTATGTITFDGGLSGDFIVALKGGNAFSLFYFIGVEDVTSIDYTMTGVGMNRPGTSALGLSNASLFTLRTTTSVPEPSTMLLLATGLLGLAARARRREGDALA